jgi:acetyltransferase-like isoleucine patch superfamily enzyme
MRRRIQSMLRSATSHRGPVVRLGYAARRGWIIARLRALAIWHSASVEVDIDPSALLGPRLAIFFQPGTHTRVRIGPRTMFGDGVVLRLKGGELDVGEACDIRRDVNLSIGGRLVIGEDSILSWGTIVHCDDDIRIGAHVGVSEQCTIADSSHYFSAPEVAAHAQIRTAPIRIGMCVWLCAKVSVSKGVTIGDYVIVGPNSVVVRDVAGGTFASGIPAVEVGPAELPWMPPPG